MRKRNHFVGVWLSEQEYQQLEQLCEASGLTASVLLRKLILGSQLRPRPPDAYAGILRELSAIGNNVNQIAYRANARKGITDVDVQHGLELIHKAWKLVKDTL